MADKIRQADYTKRLALLVGQDFQDEVCARLRTIIIDFQRIPPLPSGDGGLDGLSNSQDHAYFMYGPTLDPKRRKALPKKLTNAIVNKFKEDMRKLYELTGRVGSLKHKQNTEIKTILANGQKIRHIVLIVNTYESHRILGPLNTAKRLYETASGCQHVIKQATLVVWGPQELAELAEVDEHTLFRAEKRGIEDRIQKAIETQKARSPKSKPPKQDFDDKFDWLITRKRMSAERAIAISKPLLAAWTESVIFDRELANLSPRLHRKLEQVRQQSMLDAALQSGDAMSQIRSLRSAIRAYLSEELCPDFSPSTVNRAADGETARSIGECPLDWRDD